MRVLFQIALVALGSAVGGLTRWGVTMCAGRLLGTAFPWGTLFINISGSLFLGWFSTVLADRLHQGGWLQQEDLRLMVAVGFTGAYTTFSTFEYELHGMLLNRETLSAMTYLVASLVLGLLAMRLARILARWR